MVRLTGTERGSSYSRQHPQPRNYFSRREQYRLLMLVFSLMLVVVLMVEAGKPKNWEWMWGGSDAARELPSNVTGEEIDTRLATEPERRNLDIPGSFVALRDADEPEQEEVESSGGPLTRVNFELLKQVHDNTVLRPQEFKARFHLFHLLDEASADEIDQSEPRRVGFVQLFRQPEEYRGKLVTVQGTIRRAHRLTAPRNEYGIEGYWRCWLQSAGGPSSPIVVHALDMPPGFTSGMDLREPATFTGFFYKRWAYDAQGGIMTAPLVLAKIGRWQPPPPASPSKRPTAGIVTVGVVVAATIGILIALVVYLQSRAVSSETAAYASHLQADQDDFDALQQADLKPGVSESLRQMSDSDRQDDAQAERPEGSASSDTAEDDTG